MDDILMGIYMFKIMNCITLRFRDKEIYSRNYVASCQKKRISSNVPNKKGLAKSPHSQALQKNVPEFK
jgi:hypothetical protein